MPLTQQQIRAAELLSKGHSQTSVAEMIGVGRRTVVRWLTHEDFKNLSFGFISRQTTSTATISKVSRVQQKNLTASDLVEDALLTIQEILQNPEARNSDRLAASRLIKDWVYDEFAEVKINRIVETRLSQELDGFLATLYQRLDCETLDLIREIAAES